ncbi:DUF7544 domain-containing protein [Halorarius litoreus]|uniref:DUF7544 domain-containing protein n=1 Tax=Halorarius litoreus TaxID=2962676 RepID=UPI0020CCD7E9|nr:hypothetical protein [Halorarius litoreus]
MSLFALDNLDDALDVTRDLLTPINRSLWLKLALVVFFIGGPGANLNSFQYSFSGNGDEFPVPPGQVQPGDLTAIFAIIAVVVGVVLLFALLFLLVGAVMEFVFVESLRSGEVTIRRYWGRRWRQGLRLFGFRIAIGLLVFAAVLLLTLPFVLPLIDGAEPSPGLVLTMVLVLIPAFIVLGVVVGLVNGFTTVFVVPIMVLEDRTVLGGWRRLWPTITRHWTQYLAYVVASFFLSIAGGFLILIATLLLALVLLIPFGLLFALGLGLLAIVEPVGIAVLVFAVFLFILSVIVAAAIVQVPVQTYLRYYALLVLGDIESEFDLIPEQRAAVREGTPSAD